MGNKSLSEAYNANTTYVQNQIDDLNSEVNQGIDAFISNKAQLASDLSNYVLGEDLYDVTNVAGDVAARFIEAKLQSLKEALTSFSTVEVRALAQEITPYVKSPEEAASALGTKLGGLVQKIGIGGSFWKDLGDEFISFASNDPAVQTTLANLNSVKIFADVLNTMSDGITTVKRVFRIIEPVIPVVNAASNLFLAMRTQNVMAGTSYELECQQMVNQRSQELVTLMLGSFRKYIYSLKVRVPNLLLGAMNTLSVRDVVTGDWSNGWLGTIFDEDFYDKTVYSYTWEESWNKTIRDTLGSAENALSKWENLDFKDAKGNPLTRGAFIKSRFMTVFTQNFMRQAVATARKEARIRTYSKSDWVINTDSNTQIISNKANKPKNILEYTQYLKESNSSKLSPFNTIDSIRLLSGQILERYL